MKTIIFGIISLTVSAVLFSCNDLDNDQAITSVDRVTIDSVAIEKDTMKLNETQRILTFSRYQNNCQGFYNYEYIQKDFDRNVTAYKFQTEQQCGEEVNYPSRINFQPVQKGTYQFHFWNGKDKTDADLWIDKTIVVE